MSDRLTTRINDKVYYAKGKYGDTTLAAEMETKDIREVLKKLADYEDKEHQTNADRIRNMSDEELANVFIQVGVDGCRNSCYKCIFNNKNDDCVLDSGTTIEFIIEWLQSEAKESEEE